ncbi:MAG TPA: AgmX/PglI C-terminal domain-containing protein [Archangium sp.]|jgi:hypothetical protein
MGPNDQWLFREGDLILGPVPSQQIIDRLYAGELTGHSEVQLMGSGVFQKVADHAEFKVHVAKAEAKKRVDAHAQEHHASQKKNLQRALAIGAGVLVAVGITVGVIGNSLAKRSLDGKSAEELAWGDITIDAPSISKAKRREDDELVDYQGSTKKPPTGTTPTTLATAKNPQPTGTTRPPTGTTKTPTPNNDPDGMSMGEVDEAGINSVVAKNKATLIPCIKTVAKPGVYLRIPIEFSIAEAGKVSKVWVDNPDLKDSGLQECLLKELQKWPFKPGHAGNSVNLSFNVGKKG